MKKNTLKTRLWALAATLLLLISLLAMPVSATNSAPTENLTTTFDKYLVMDANANVPNVTFNFSIAAGDAVNASDDNQKIYAGIGNPVIGVESEGTVTAGGAVFTPDDTTTSGTPTNSDDTTQKYATKEMTVDFSGISFTAPGIYRYIITETASTASGITNDAVSTRTLDVYVQYKNTAESGQDPVYSNTELEVSHYVLHEGLEDPAAQGEEKSDGFTNTYTTYDLTLAKTVTGNQGDRDKFFKFTVTISNAVPGTVYDVTIPTTDAPTQNDLEQGDSIDNVNLDKLTVGSAQAPETTGSVTATYYIKHNQSIVIQGLTSDTAYTITETDYSTDGYTTTFAIDSGSAVTSNATPSENNTMNSSDHTVTFTNTKNGTVPTGILLETAPYLILGAVVVAGLVVLFATRRRRTRE